MKQQTSERFNIFLNMERSSNKPDHRCAPSTLRPRIGFRDNKSFQKKSSSRGHHHKKSMSICAAISDMQIGGGSSRAAHFPRARSLSCLDTNGMSLIEALRFGFASEKQMSHVTSHLAEPTFTTSTAEKAYSPNGPSKPLLTSDADDGSLVSVGEELQAEAQVRVQITPPTTPKPSRASTENDYGSPPPFLMRPRPIVYFDIPILEKSGLLLPDILE